MNDTDEVVVTVQDLAALGYCRRGSRAFFLRHGFEWELFLQQGITATELENTHDAMASAAIEQAKRRIAESGQ